MATILVVDDRDLNRSVLTTLLGHGGHRLLEASNGPDGRALEAGAEMFFQEPIDNEEFFGVVQKALLKSGTFGQEAPRK